MDQEIAWRLFTKGITRAEAMKSVKFSGNRSLAERVLDVVSIIA